MMRHVLGSRASIGGVLGSGRGAAATSQWWLSGGVSAANAIAAYQPIGAASLAASYVNLANPGTYNAAPGVAPTWAAATGWTFNGSTQYLMTGVNPYPASAAWSILVRYGASPTTGALIGTYASATNASLIQIISSGGYKFRVFNNSNSVAPDVVGISGVFGFAAQIMYRDGSVTGSAMSVGTTPNSAYFISAYNNSGSPAAFYNGKIQAIAIYNSTLTAPQMAAISTAMAALTG